MMEKPEPPGDYECCDSGCDTCVWDIYAQQMQVWNAANKAGADRPRENAAAQAKVTGD